MKRRCALIFALILTMPLFTKSLTAGANSALTHWQGATATGVIVTGEDCPLSVEKELLTFDISDFPTPHASNEGYQSFVSAEYTFYNPTDLDLDIELAFPLGNNPHYMTDLLSSDKSHKYKVEVNGAEIESNIRYTYITNYQFPSGDIEKVKRLHESEVLIDEQTMAYTYYFTASAGSYKIVSDGAQSSSIVSNYSLIRTLGSEGVETFVKLSSADTVSVCVIGEKPKEIYLMRKQSAGTEENMVYPIQNKEEQGLFFDLISQEWQSIGAEYVSKEEYFKAIVDVITLDNNSSESSTYCLGKHNIIHNLISWYEYDLQVGAGERITNKITAPIYPSIDASWVPPKYEYTYLLSPASCWQSFGELEIVIKTDAYLLKSEGFDFVKIDGGYSVKLNGLPDRELIFSLSDKEYPKKKRRYGCFLNISSEAISILSILIILIAIRLYNKQKTSL